MNPEHISNISFGSFALSKLCPLLLLGQRQEEERREKWSFILDCASQRTRQIRVCLSLLPLYIYIKRKIRDMYKEEDKRREGG
jgi:hypothetical protein